MIAVLFQVIVGLFSVIYVAMKKSVDIAKTSFYAAVINISTNGILVGFIGLYAASVSTLLAYATMAIYRYLHVKRYIDITLRKKNIVIIAILAGIAIFAYYYGSLLLKCLSLIFIAGCSIYLNWGFLKSSLDMFIIKVFGKK